MKRWLMLPWTLLFCAGAITAWAQTAATSTPPKVRKVQYARDVQPILSANCFSCHGPDEKTRKGGLRLDDPREATKEQRSGERAIVPGDVQASEAVARILSTNKRKVMPPPVSHKELKAPEKLILQRWIEEGAVYEKHWAFVPPKQPALPSVKNPSWPRQPFDFFILARLEAEGLTPMPEADRYTLARRVALDLTGLPPTLEAIERFVQDPSPDAYEKYVDAVLRLPTFGEHWAHVWLDLARYADSNGYATDNPRSIWKYRDWVIDAFNRNMPFDRFTVEQIGGDLLPRPSQDQLIATAFHRNTLTNDEGGTSDEEFRVAAVVDRVNTTFQVFMAITMSCAQCHSHKYDPISQEEFFKVYAIFNQSEDADRSDNSPVLATPTAQQLEQKAQLEKEITALEKELKGPASDKAKQAQLATAKKQLSNLKIVSTPIMRDLPEGKRRKTRLHIRGNFLDEGKEVTAGVPALFHPLPKDLPPNRLALARWLVDSQNPLTARVAVNRFWEQIFGVGLVETPEDFGIRGKLPTHPELLDWLATHFVADGWNVKNLLKRLVTSATYRQAAKVTPALAERDYDNRLFARGPRFRSQAEVIRDQALFVSGLLSPKRYGPPVRPPRPKLGLTAAFGGGTDWETSPGDDKHRRALYTEWRRTTPYPSMIAFDAPSRNVCALTRPHTNTPLQALVTMNDPVYIEAAQALARRLVKEGGSSVESRATYGFRLCLTRPPRPAEVQRLVNLFQKARQEYAGKPKEAQAMATDPLGPLPPGLDPADMAAWTVVGNVLLNLDEMLAKR